MDRAEAIHLLRQGDCRTFNSYRAANPSWIPDFAGADLSGVSFVSDWGIAANLDRAVLVGTKLPQDRDKYRTNHVAVPMRDALIDARTNGPALDWLTSYGAVFLAQKQLATRVESARIFISYAWANSDVVHAIDRWLRTKGLSTVIDQRDFFAGSRIRDEISRGMSDCNVILLFHSKQSKDKPWIEFERELLGDLQISAKKQGKEPPRAIYVVIDATPLPSISEENRIAILANGKRFELVCEEIYHHVLRLPRENSAIDLTKWEGYVFGQGDG